MEKGHSEWMGYYDIHNISQLLFIDHHQIPQVQSWVLRLGGFEGFGYGRYGLMYLMCLCASRSREYTLRFSRLNFQNFRFGFEAWRLATNTIPRQIWQVMGIWCHVTSVMWPASCDHCHVTFTPLPRRWIRPSESCVDQRCRHMSITWTSVLF